GSRYLDPRRRPSVAGGRAITSLEFVTPRLTRGPSLFARTLLKRMDGRVEPGHDKEWTPSRRRHGFLHRGDQLAQRERFWQEGELLVLRQALVEGILGIARDEDDLEVRIAAP